MLARGWGITPHPDGGRKLAAQAARGRVATAPRFERESQLLAAFVRKPRCVARPTGSLVDVPGTSHVWSLPPQVCLPAGLAAVRGRTFILYHPVAPPLSRAVREAHVYRKLRDHFESVCVYIWVGQPFPPPSTEAREVYADAFASGPGVDAVAWMVDSDRYLSTSLITSLSTQLFPRGAKARVFRDPFEAACWIHQFEGGDTEEILNGLDELDRATPESF